MCGARTRSSPVFNGMTIFKFTPEKLAMLIEKYPHEDSQKLADELGCGIGTLRNKVHKLQLKKSDACAAERYAKHGRNLKGKIPMSNSNKPIAGWNKTAIGDIRKTYDGYMKIKVAPGKCRLLHQVNWEAKFGKVPKGSVLSAKDGNTCNVDPDNWICQTRKEIFLQNSIHNLPPELAELCQLRAKLERVINGK